MAEELRNRFRAMIYTAFDRWGQRSMESFLRRLSAVGSDAREVYERQVVEQGFLERRAKDPGLARYVLKQTLRSKVLNKHMITLLRSALISIAAKDSPGIKDLSANSPAGPPDAHAEALSPGYTPRTLRRLRKEEYPEVFFDQGAATDDGRSEKVSTIFGPSPLPKNEATDDAAAYLASDRVKVLSTPGFREHAQQVVSIRDVEPEYLEALRDFGRNCDRVIGQLLGRRTMSKEALQLLHEEFGKHPELTQILFNHVLSILAVKWFRGKSKAEKAGLLKDKFPLSYTKKDAIRAHALLEEMFDARAASLFLTNMVSFALRVLGLPREGMHIHEAILDLHPNDTRAQAAAWDNIGTCWREIGDHTKAIEAMEKAIPLHRQSGDAYRELVAERNIGEALIRMGRREEGLTRFGQIQKRIPELRDSNERFGVWLNLAMGAGRCGLPEMEYELLTRSLEENPDTDRLLAVGDRLLHLNLQLPNRGGDTT